MRNLPCNLSPLHTGKGEFLRAFGCSGSLLCVMVLTGKVLIGILVYTSILSGLSNMNYLEVWQDSY